MTWYRPKALREYVLNDGRHQNTEKATKLDHLKTIFYAYVTSSNGLFQALPKFCLRWTVNCKRRSRFNIIVSMKKVDVLKSFRKTLLFLQVLGLLYAEEQMTLNKGSCEDEIECVLLQTPHDEIPMGSREWIPLTYQLWTRLWIRLKENFSLVSEQCSYQNLDLRVCGSQSAPTTTHLCGYWIIRCI